MTFSLHSQTVARQVTMCLAHVGDVRNWSSATWRLTVTHHKRPDVRRHHPRERLVGDSHLRDSAQ